MWKCPKCSEPVEDSFDSCWNCGTGKDGSPPPKGFGAVQPEDSAEHSEHPMPTVMTVNSLARVRIDEAGAYKSGGAQSVVVRLKIIAGVVKIACAIVGLVLGIAVGTMLAGDNNRAVGGSGKRTYLRRNRLSLWLSYRRFYRLVV
jgi:hypothetical protein